MSDARVPSGRERRSSRAQFRCQVCERFVIATDFGVCPRCGLGPPNISAIAEGPPDPIAWRDARRRARQLDIGSAYWLTVMLFAVAVAVGVALLVVY